MDKVLLLVSDSSLRQLYHELLMSKKFEIVPMGDISHATVLLMLSQYLAVVMCVEPTEQDQTRIFLNLRNQHPKLNRTKLILVARDISPYQQIILDNDFLLNSKVLPAEEIVKIIKQLLVTGPP